MDKEAPGAKVANSLESLLDFIRRLELARIAYRLECVRDAIMVSVAVPGQRWEFEFFANGEVEVECFVSTSMEQTTHEFIEDFFATWSE